ncbi:MAG: polysaccharide biosynthesis protein [Phycisphaerae bacterium]|nr:polysaccharide biosynthesis protein [Phycisphaerae bacterium]
MSEQQAHAWNQDEDDHLKQDSWSLRLRLRLPMVILGHAVMFTGALLLSFLMVNNMQFKRVWVYAQYPLLLCILMPVKLLVFGQLNQYRGWWRYVGISDLLGIFRASLISTMAGFGLWFGLLSVAWLRRGPLGTLAEISQGIFVADLFSTIMLLAGLRMVVRLYHEEMNAEQGMRLKRFVIVGAGNAGESLVREIKRASKAQYDVVGFIDDAPAKQGVYIHGTPVLGTVDQLHHLCELHRIDEIAIAMPSASHQQLRRVIQVCEGTKIRFRTVPALMDIASGKLKVSQIRDVDINDLLGRAVVVLDLESIETYLNHKTVLVTGAGGSIGSEMCRQICQFHPKQLLLVEQAENSLFYIERELSRTHPDVVLRTLICNITDQIRVYDIFNQFRPEVVIHAAAHKHVPLMELNPGEAVKNNVHGTRTVADAADQYGASNFVMISTDKAVNPTSIMGSCKRVAEMYIQDLSRTSMTAFATVRFGNVLGSEGSVVPIFKQQIARGGPVTVTDPEMKRYFMTIPEASQLVLQAATMGQGGEIFALDMGEPVKIVDLAKELITLSGFRPGEDIDIEFTGLRPGEKLFEELSIEGEDMQSTYHPKIGIWQKNSPMTRQTLRHEIDVLLSIAPTQNHAKIVAQIKRLVPEYTGGPAPVQPMPDVLQYNINASHPDL